MLFHWLHIADTWRNDSAYNFISGDLPDTALFGWPIGALVLYLKSHNCHVQGCWRLKWHTHPEHGHPVCKHHHPHDPANLGGDAL